MPFVFPIRYELEDNKYIKIGKLLTQVRTYSLNAFVSDALRGMRPLLPKSKWRSTVPPAIAVRSLNLETAPGRWGVHYRPCDRSRSWTGLSWAVSALTLRGQRLL